MTNPYYSHGNYPPPGSAGSATALRAELELIEAGFDKLPPTVLPYGFVRWNAAATQMETIDGITGAPINSSVIGGITPAAGTFTTLLAANATISGSIIVPTRASGSTGAYAASVDFVNAAIISPQLPGQAGNSGKFLSTDGTTGSWASIDLRGEPSTAKPASGVAAQVFNYATGGEGQSLEATGTFAFTATGFPVGRTAGILIMAKDWGAYAPTSTGITWFKSDGTTTTNFATSGITLPAAGVGKLALWSIDGVTVYGQGV